MCDPPLLSRWTKRPFHLLLGRILFTSRLHIHTSPSDKLNFIYASVISNYIFIQKRKEKKEEETQNTIFRIKPKQKAWSGGLEWVGKEKWIFFPFFRFTLKWVMSKFLVYGAEYSISICFSSNAVPAKPPQLSAYSGQQQSSVVRKRKNTPTIEKEN